MSMTTLPAGYSIRPITPPPTLREIEKAAIVDAMERHNGKQKDVAERAGVSQAYVSDLLHGRRDMTPKALEKLCDAIDVDDNTRANLHVMGARLAGWNV